MLARTASISEELVDVRSPALSTSFRLESALLNQETGIRGHGATGIPDFLQPYRQGLTDQQTHTAQLAKLLAGDTAGLGDLKSVQDAAQQWQDRIARPVAATPPGTPSPLTTERAGDGKAAFDTLRTAVVDQQERLRAERRRTREDLAATMRLRNGVFTAIALVIAALAGLVSEALRRGITTPPWNSSARTPAPSPTATSTTPSPPPAPRTCAASSARSTSCAGASYGNWPSPRRHAAASTPRRPTSSAPTPSWSSSRLSPARPAPAGRIRHRRGRRRPRPGPPHRGHRPDRTLRGTGRRRRPGRGRPGLPRQGQGRSRTAAPDAPLRRLPQPDRTRECRSPHGPPAGAGERPPGTRAAAPAHPQHLPHHRHHPLPPRRRNRPAGGDQGGEEGR